jgi:hypothetical protein
MNPLSTPPTDPGQVVIVIQRQGLKILAATFKYKKGHWFGTTSGMKFTTEELVEPDGEAGWIISPLQPQY